MRTGSIYIIRNKCNNKVYIGQTTQSVRERFMQHLKPSTMKQRGTYKIYNAIKKYGKENFYYEIIEENIPAEDIDTKEIYYIDKYNSFKGGYNSTNGGDTKTICKIQDIEKLKEMFNNKLTYNEIAEYFGVNRVTVCRTLESLGIKRNSTIPKEFLIENKDIMTNKEIAKLFGVHSETVSRAFKRYGIKRGKGCSNHLNKQNQKRN